MRERASQQATNKEAMLKAPHRRVSAGYGNHETQKPAASLLSLQRSYGNRFVQRMLREPRSKCACGGGCSSCQSGEKQRKQSTQLALRRSLQQLQPVRGDLATKPAEHLKQTRFGADLSSVFTGADAHAAQYPMSHMELSGPAVRTKKIAGVDVTKADCDCIDKMQDEGDWAKSQVKRYSDCKADPVNKTGKNIEDCVHAQLAKEGISTTVAGTTSSTGVVSVKKTKGPCAAIVEKGTAIHEGVHATHQAELEKMYGKGTAAFTAHWSNDANDWAQDEMNAYGAEIPFYQAVAAHLRSVCGPINTTGAIVGGIVGGIGGAVLGGVLGGVGGAIGLGVVGAGVGALAGGLIGNLFED